MELTINRPRALLSLLETYREAIITDACAAHERVQLPRYQEAGAETCEERHRKLFDLVVECVRTQSLDPVVRHGERVAWERFEAGYDFREVHTAYNLVEEAIWKQIIAHVPKEALAEALGVTGTVLNTAKASMAAEYIALTTQTRTVSPNLFRMFQRQEAVED